MADVATLVFDIDSAPAGSAARALLQLDAAASKAARGVDKLEAANRGSDGRFRSAAKFARENALEIERLAQRYNPLMAAQLNMTRAEQEVARAVRLGVVAAEDKGRVLAQLRGQYDMAGAAAVRFGQSNEAARAHVANLSFQLNDIGMMMALGQSPFMLMMQQGPQVAQVLGQMTSQGQKLGPALVGALGSILNPMTAVTLAVIGGTAALVQWATAAGEGAVDTDALVETLGNLTTVTGEYRSAIDSARMTQLQLIADYGSQAAAAEQLLDAQVRLREFALVDTARAAQATISAGFSDMAFHVETALLGFERLNAEMMRASPNMEDIASYAGIAAMGVDDLQEQFRMGVGEAQNLLAAVDAMASASGPYELAQATITMAEELIKARDNGALIPPEMIRVANEAATAAAEILRLAGLLQQASDVASGIVIPLGATTGNGLTMGDIRLPGDIPGAGGRRRGGGGGGKSEIDEMKERWEEMNTLATEQYTRDLEVLDWALSQKLIKEEEYQARRRALAIENFGTEYQQNILQAQTELDQLQMQFDQKLIAEETYLTKRAQLQWQYAAALQEGENNRWSAELNGLSQGFAEMNSLAGGGYDQLLRAQKIFAAASALISTYQGAAKALELPFPMNLIAMGKVMAAGLGLVSAIKGGGKASGGRGSTSTPAASAAAAAPPMKNILINIDGPEWLQDMVGGIMEEIYEQSRDGRVIIARAN